MSGAAVVSTSDPMLSMGEAAAACGLSRSTLQRRKTDLIAAGATVSPAGWLIPRSALTQLGLLPAAPTGSTPVTGIPAAQAGEVARLQAALANALRRAEVAEAVAQERQAALERADRALLLLAANSSPAAATDPRRQQARTVLQQVRRTAAAARRQLLQTHLPRPLHAVRAAVTATK